MNTFKGTPGRWFVNNKRGTLVTADNGEIAKNQMRNVCQPYGGSLYDDDLLSGDTERMANAMLIAASKDMLEALQECIIQIEYLHGKFQETGSGNTVLGLAKAALSKALD